MSNELHLQEKFVIPFFRESLGYQEVKANTIEPSALIIEEDLQAFISDSSLNREPYAKLLRKYRGDRKKLLADLIELIQERAAVSRNMALFLHANKSITLEGVKLYLFYTSGSEFYEDTLFAENVFSVVQELPYQYHFNGKKIYSFRPDLTFFVNGLYLGYSELKYNYTGQSASNQGRAKVVKDYFDAIRVYYEVFDSNPMLSEKEKAHYRRDFLKIFERAIHITACDVKETYIIRTLTHYFDSILESCRAGRFDREAYEQKLKQEIKHYPVHTPGAEPKAWFAEVFSAHYGTLFMEKEILYYNFIERDVQTDSKGRKGLKNELGHLIAPRPKQKFGTDKIMARIDEFLAHEQDDDYYIEALEKQLAHVSASKRHDLIEKRKKYANNKNAYSLLMQYAAGFGKSNIIGWSALQLKDLRKDGEYVYDKVMIVVDRVQLRGQIDSKMLNMNIDNKMFIEAHNKNTFLEAMQSDTRLVIVNIQKFGDVTAMLDQEVLQKLASQRVVFLIDEIHRSNSGAQNEEMINVFDALQTRFDANTGYNQTRTKKNLIIGFTATPDDRTLARFGEFSGYAESEKIWAPFDAYTMNEAIKDGFILNPLKNIIPVATKMIFEVPENELEGFEEADYKNAAKKQIYENRERIDEIAGYVADLLVKDVYRNIRGTAKAMLAVYSIKSAIAYKDAVTQHFNELTKQKKYERYKEAPIFIVYSSNQDEQAATNLNGGRSEKQVLNDFANMKNGLIIVVAKLQTGFDEKRLHTLFLDKEIRNITAIQTISRVNRTTKYKNECKIIDFSYQNVNVQTIKDAFEHFSDVVVSDFDPMGEEKVLNVLFGILKKSEVYEFFFALFASIYADEEKRETPESFLDFSSSVEKYIDTHERHSADIKAKASQFFTILNRIEYVIALEPQFKEATFLHFYQKFNAIYNMMHRIADPRDPIKVYFDNQIGMVEVTPEDLYTEKKKQETSIQEGDVHYGSPRQLSILDIIEERNQNEAEIGDLIREFEEKILAFFDYVKSSNAGRRVIVKINSHAPEDEIYDGFAKIYRTYKAIYKKRVGEFFFKETSDLVEKLCDDFEALLRKERIASLLQGL